MCLQVICPYCGIFSKQHWKHLEHCLMTVSKTVFTFNHTHPNDTCSRLYTYRLYNTHFTLVTARFLYTLSLCLTLARAPNFFSYTETPEQREYGKFAMGTDVHLLANVGLTIVSGEVVCKLSYSHILLNHVETHTHYRLMHISTHYTRVVKKKGTAKWNHPV